MTDVINNVKNFIKKHWILIWLIIVVLLLVSSVSYAAYTNLNSVKRVVSVKGGAGTLFSSNNLQLKGKGDTNYSSKKISVSSGETSQFEIDICNYAQDDPSKFNDNDISYTLTLTLIDASENQISDDSGYSTNVLKNGETAGQFTSGESKNNGTLTGKQQSTDKYVITVPNKFITDNIRIKAEAVPDDTSYGATGNQKLARIFNFAETTTTISGWTGDFLETTASDYDGFNYIVKGQGKGTITLEWDSSKLEMSDVFIKENNLEVTTGENNKRKITMSVDSSEKNRYDIQFYKTSDSGYDSISDVKSYITNFNYQEQTTQENTANG